MKENLCKCGRFLRNSQHPSGRVDNPWITLRVTHKLATLADLSPTIAQVQQLNLINFFEDKYT